MNTGGERIAPVYAVGDIVHSSLRLVKLTLNGPDFHTIVLDEFHERSLHADLGIALARQAWPARNDLRLVVMSATRDTAGVAVTTLVITAGPPRAIMRSHHAQGCALAKASETPSLVRHRRRDSAARCRSGLRRMATSR